MRPHDHPEGHFLNYDHPETARAEGRRGGGAEGRRGGGASMPQADFFLKLQYGL